jgi:hypothetical protein
MLAVVLIKRQLNHLDGRLPLGYDTRKGMEPLTGLAAPSEAVPGFNQGQFARSRLLWLRLFPRHAHRHLAARIIRRRAAAGTRDSVLLRVSELTLNPRPATHFPDIAISRPGFPLLAGR